MATQRKPATPEPAKPADPQRWQGILDGMKSSGVFSFPQEGKTRIRLVLTSEGDPYNFFREVTNSYGKTKYLFFVLLPGSDDPALVRPFIAPKTVITDILSMLAEGYDLFSEDEAFGVTINRTGSGLDSKYSVLPSHKAQPLPAGIQWPDHDLDEFAEIFLRNAVERGKKRVETEGSEEEEPEEKPPSKRRKSEPSW